MTSISLDISSDKVQKDLTCHLVPCNITYNGATSVSEYFDPYIREQDSHLTCSLRGYPLKGQKINVPDGYMGVILKEDKKFSVSDDKRDLKKVAMFKEFTAWNWDIVPSSDDKLVKALQWVDVASLLHKPVSEYTDDHSENLKTQVKRKFNDLED